MSFELHQELKLRHKRIKTVKFVDGEAGGHGYVHKSDHPLRTLLRVAFECDAYGSRPLMDSANPMLEAIHRLNSAGFPSHALIPLFWPTLSDFGEGMSDSHNRAKYDRDPVIISTAPEDEIVATAKSAIGETIARRDQFPPFGMFSSDQVRSVWPEIGPTTRLIDVHAPYRNPNLLPHLEVHPISASTSEQAVATFLNTYSPFFVGALGLQVISVNATRTADYTYKHYYPHESLDPNYQVDSFAADLLPRKKGDWTLYLSDKSLRPRLTVLGPRMALAATVGSLNHSHTISIDRESTELVREAISRYGTEHAERINAKIAAMYRKVESTQKRLQLKTQMTLDFPKYGIPAPKNPYPNSLPLSEVLNNHLHNLGY